MIKTTIIALIEGRRYEFTSELAEVAGWADTAGETAIGLLHDGMDQLARAIEHEPWPVDMPTLRDCLNGDCAKCFNPAMCACECHRTRVRLVDENGNRQCYLCGFYHDEPGSCATGTPSNITPGPDDEPEYTGPTDDDSDRFMPEVGDENDRPIDDEDSDWDGPEAGDYSADRRYDDDECAAANRPIADIVRERIGRSVVEASKRDEADQ